MTRACDSGAASMRMATIVSLGASAALGVGALVVAKVWLPAQTPRTQTTAAAAVQPGVPIVIASSAIAFGARLDARNLRVVTVPRAAAPQGAFSSVAQVINQPGGAPVALQPMSPQEAVLPSRISGPGARASLAASISPGMRAYTIGVTDVLGGGGHILPGDRVDVVLTRELPTDNETRGRQLISSVVTQDVRVLGMDLNIDPSSSEAAVAHTATLELTLQNSVRLALATQAGTLSLALRRTGSSEIEVQRPIALDNPRSWRRQPSSAASTPPTAAANGLRPAIDPSQRSLVVSAGATQSTVQVPADRAGY